MKTLEDIRASSRIRSRRYYLKHKKECIERCYAWRDKNIEKFRASQRKHYLKKRDFYLERSRNRYKLFGRKTNPKHRISLHYREPLKDKARMAVTYAIQVGKLKRPRHCSKCKLKSFIEAHHENYNKPLVVKWLCKRCHHLRHRDINDKNKLN